ncbi:MAG TPA: hypothetical protein VN764_19165 [Polyangiaceae bacterium]|nr:hypothetical protein [Polyangiaceae bacterium]
MHTEETLFRRAHELLFRHPGVTQEIFRALVVEGRAYAQTPEGAALQQRLLHSPHVARARMLWDVISLSAFTPDEGPLPSVVVHEFARAALTEGLEEKLARLFEQHV